MTTAERLKKVESTLAELNIRMAGAGGGGGAPHNLLSATHPDTDPDSPVRGDILRGIAGPEWQRYALGAAGTYLRSDGNDIVFSAIQAGDLPAHAAEHEVGGGDLVDHDALTNFVANEHIDHTAITLTAGEGLSGGGTIAANRTFDLDVNGLVEDAAGASGDFFVYYDTVAGDHKKIDWDDMPGGGGASPWTVDVNDIYWDGTGHATIGAIAPDSKMTVAGFNIYTPATANDLHFAIQNADVNHAFTDFADADTYFSIQKVSASGGGAKLSGFSEAGSVSPVQIWGYVPLASAVYGTGTDAPVALHGAESNGTGAKAVADNEVIVVFVNYTTSVLCFTGDGSIIAPDIGGTIKWFLGDSLNTKMTTGFTIQQRGWSDEALAIKSTFVSQGYTTPHEVDTYFAIQKYHSTEGGASIHGMGEVTVGVEIKGGGDTDNVTKSAAGIAPIILNATKSAAGTWGSVGADGNLAAIQNNGSSVWIMDAEGDSWQNGTLHIDGMKSGANQGAAGAAANELWRDTADNSVKLGV